MTMRILYLIRRFLSMGPTIALTLVYFRLKKRWFIVHWYRQWRKGFTFHAWEQLPLRKQFGSFDEFFKNIRQQDYCSQILTDPLFTASLPINLRGNNIHAQAQSITQSTITLLGFGSYKLPTPIPWHHDFTIAQASPQAWRTAFYTDITIPNNTSSSHTQRMPEIKVSWELSRMQHVAILAIAYHQAAAHNDTQKMILYATTFKQHIADWIDTNPFLQGVNWANPMEVAIRSINLTWALHLFKQEVSIEHDFWQKYISMLYDHALYLEHNWEISDKPNNHYLADLVGYLYLCSLFSDNAHFQRNKKRTVKKLIAQWKQQTLRDGTSYEGSTNYHKLDTELMLHFMLLCKHTNTKLPNFIHQNYQVMQTFLRNCWLPEVDLIQIGDNDSGSIVTGLSTSLQSHQQKTLTTYQNFGLSIIRNNQWHITLRHPTYQSYQPTGHFHEDQLSVTVTINTIPILVDPGTYLYTSHPSLRNTFRSFDYHNTFFIHNPQNTTQTHPDLFQLKHIPQRFHAHSERNNHMVTIQDCAYHLSGQLTAHRKLTLDQQEQCLSITDWWEKEKKELSEKEYLSTWNLHFDPTLTLEQQTESLWIIKQRKIIIAYIESSLPFTLTPTFFSPQYGKLQNSLSLHISKPLAWHKEYIRMWPA